MLLDVHHLSLSLNAFVCCSSIGAFLVDIHDVILLVDVHHLMVG